MLIQIFLGFILTATAVIGTRILDVNFGVSAFCGPLNDLSELFQICIYHNNTSFVYVQFLCEFLMRLCRKKLSGMLDKNN